MPENARPAPDPDDVAPATEAQESIGEPAHVHVDRPVLVISASVVAAVVVLGSVFPDRLASTAQTVLTHVIDGFGWAFVLGASAFVVFALWLAFSRYGRIPLGPDGEKPEFSTRSWVAMMFSAGMGIGLMFYGVTEPISHLVEPPVANITPGSQAAAKQAMNYTMFHWALHPWAIYAVVGLALAYAQYRKGRTGGFSAAFVPLLGRRATGGAGRAIDVLAIFATLFGSATSLGLGALQINGGLGQVLDVKIGTTAQILVIAVLTVCFVISAVSGVAKGIQLLSNVNMVLAVVLLLFLFVVGPTVFILNLIPAMTGNYLVALPTMATRTGAFGGHDWLAAWTIFYWAWWISWTPFVGAFIARISRGRTIRQFVLGVMAAPSIVSLVWFAVLGGSAIRLQETGAADIAKANSESQQAAMFAVLDQFPWAGATTVLVVVLVAIFFVSGADAASVVMGSLSSRGAEHPPRGIVVLWGVLTGAVAAVLLLAGGLEGLKTLTIIVAAPFLVIMAALCVSLARDLRHDPAARKREHRQLIPHRR
jgi:glycine betaine transporter